MGRSYSRSRSRSRTPRSDRSRGRSRSRSRSNDPAPRRCSREDERVAKEAKSDNHFGSRYNPSKSCILGIFGMSLYTDQRKLDDLFGKYGRISKIAIVEDRGTRKSRGFGFITFEHPDDAADAREAINGMTIDDRKVRVDFSITKKAHSPTPGGYRGRDDQRRERRDRSRSRSRDRRRRSRSRDRSRRSRSRDYGRRERSRSYDRYRR